MSLDGDEKGKIVDRLRQSLQPRSSTTGAPPLPAAAPATDFDGEDLDILRRGSDIYHVSLDSDRKFGKSLGLARRVWRKLLKPLLIRQVHYNSANARLLEAMQAKIERIEADKAAFHGEVRGRVAAPLSETVDRLQAQEATIEELRDALAAQRAAFQQRLKALEATEKQQSRAIVRLHRKVEALQAAIGTPPADTPPTDRSS